MNILLSIHHPLDPNKGAPGVTLKLGEAYQKLGHQVHYHSMDNLPSYLSEKVKGVMYPWFLAAHLLKLCRHQVVDVVDASTGDAWVWAKIRRRSTNPLLVTRSHGLEHVVDIGERAEAIRNNVKLSWKYKLYIGGFRLWESKASLLQADIVFLLNRADLNFAVRQLGVEPERAKLIANGIPETFLNLPFESTPTSGGSPISIAIVASYIPRKGIYYSIPALNKLLVNHAQIKVSLLGTELSGDRVLADFEPDVRNRVRAVSSFQHEMLPDLLKGHQIVLLPSLVEGFGMSLIEAMACGLAPIASEVDGPQDIIENNHDGLLIPSRNIEAIEKAVEQLLNDRSQLDYFRRNAYKKSQRYGWMQLAQQQLSFYRETLEQQKAVSQTL
jgi:glycosyltransferase involved in cell wall biosynthesis